MLESEDYVAEAVERLLPRELDDKFSGLLDGGPSERALGCFEVGPEVQRHPVLAPHLRGSGLRKLMLHFYPTFLRFPLFFDELDVESR